MNQTSQPSHSAPVKKPGTNMALIIILIVVGALLVLGVGGYFGWKYFKSKTKTSASTTTSSAKLSLKALENTFKYPGATVTKTDHTGGTGGQVSDISMETPDGLQTVYNYYLNLATQKGLTVSRKSLDADVTGGSMTLQGKGYYADIYLYQYDPNTEIDFSIFGDNITDDTAGTTTTTPKTTNSSSAKTTISTDYVISDSNSRVITTAELTTLTPWQLKVARNEIYARHGRSFVHQDLQCHFNAKSWYQANPDYAESLLTATDNKNVATILAYEQSINSPLLQVDSGC